jgi:succinate-acetate transporter protein
VVNGADLEFGADQHVTTLGWGNAGPLSLLAFAVVTLMLSLINVNAISGGVTPVVASVGLIFGGTTQLIGGLIQMRTGNTFQGLLFCSFGAFWISLAAILQWYLKEVPAAQVGHALGLLLSPMAGLCSPSGLWPRTDTAPPASSAPAIAGALGGVSSGARARRTAA